MDHDRTHALGLEKRGMRGAVRTGYTVLYCNGSIIRTWLGLGLGLGLRLGLGGVFVFVSIFAVHTPKKNHSIHSLVV